MVPNERVVARKAFASVILESVLLSESATRCITFFAMSGVTSIDDMSS